MARQFTAQYKGICTKCSQVIEVGEPITWSRRGEKGVFHASCSESAGVSREPELTLEPMESKQPAITTITRVVTAPPAESVFAVLGAAIQPYIQANLADVEQRIASALESSEERIQSQIESAIQTALENVPTHRIEVCNLETKQTTILDGVYHRLFPTLLAVLSLDLHAFLYGDAGSGKSTAARQVAEAMGIEYGYIGLTAQTTESRIFGYMDANGKYVRTRFRDCYECGGIFCIDELDNASGNLLTALNGALANGHCAFPDGLVTRHANFRCVGTGNTPCLGPSPMFPDRRPMDGAVRDRFIFVRWDTDLDLEINAALGIATPTKLKPILPPASPLDVRPFVEWIQRVRVWAKANMPRLMVSQRASINGVKLLQAGFSIADVAEMTLFKGFDRDSVSKTLQNNPLPAIR